MAFSLPVPVPCFTFLSFFLFHVNSHCLEANSYCAATLYHSLPQNNYHYVHVTATSLSINFTVTNSQWALNYRMAEVHILLIKLGQGLDKRECFVSCLLYLVAQLYPRFKFNYPLF